MEQYMDTDISDQRHQSSSTAAQSTDTVVSSQPHQSSSTGRRLPRTPTAAEVGQRKTQEFLGDVFQSPTKSRRLNVANAIKQKESERHKTLCRIRKRKQQIRDLAAKLVDDETSRARLDEQIQALKLEIVSDE